MAITSSRRRVEGREQRCFSPASSSLVLTLTRPHIIHSTYGTSHLFDPISLLPHTYTHTHSLYIYNFRCTVYVPPGQCSPPFALVHQHGAQGELEPTQKEGTESPTHGIEYRSQPRNRSLQRVAQCDSRPLVAVPGPVCAPGNGGFGQPNLPRPGSLYFVVSLVAQQAFRPREHPRRTAPSSVPPPLWPQL
jgi:hypothetical protein